MLTIYFALFQKTILRIIHEYLFNLVFAKAVFTFYFFSDFFSQIMPVIFTRKGSSI